jgi:hypothetical protein
MGRGRGTYHQLTGEEADVVVRDSDDNSRGAERGPLVPRHP